MKARLRALTAALCLALGSCSRHQEPAPAGDRVNAGSELTAPPAPLPPPTPSLAPVPAPSGGLDPDPDEAAAKRITDQNLESELDRLEREIQAE